MEALISQAFGLLMGLEALPQSGDDLVNLLKPITNHIRSSIQPSPHLEQLVQSFQTEAEAHLRPNRSKQHFVDLSTGIRLRYLEWPHSSDDVILLLHGIAQCADSWIDLGNRLSDRGYTVFAIDLRGHSGTGASPSGRYSSTHLAEDLNAFIIAKDLYIRPLAVVGCGIGGAVGLSLAATAPNLLGAVACLDFGLPPELITAVTAGPGSNSIILPENILSSEILPWWSFWLGQGIKFSSAADCAAFLMSPITNIGPVPLAALMEAGATSEADESGENTQLELQKSVLAKLARPPAAVSSDAVTMLRPVPIAGKSIARFIDDDFPDVEPKMDPKFFFSFDIATMVRQITALKAHFLVMHGEHSSMVSKADATALAGLPKNPASVSVVQIPQVGHHLLADAPKDVYNALINFLEGPAVRCFEISGGKDSRLPEALGLRPLPEYDSIEEAKKTLGPRAIPTAAAIEAELEKLRLEAGEDSEEEREGTIGEERTRNRTALAQDPPDYFGFVG